MITKDFNSWVPFIAKVEDVDDPRKVGRVRLRVINHHGDDISTEQLDWATPIIANSASLEGVGTSPTSLEVGSTVVGFYLDGHQRSMPLILGSIAAIRGGDDNRNDVHKRARGINEIENHQEGPEPSPAFAATYPHNRVVASRSGHIVELDDTPGHERVHVRHKSGSYVEINNQGRVVIKAVDDQYVITSGDSTVYTKGDAKIESKGKMTIKVQGQCNIDVTGQCNISSDSKIKLTAPVVDLMG